MLKSTIVSTLFAAAVVLGSTGAFAQENPYTKAAAPVPASIAHQQAQANDPAACGDTVARAQDNISLRIQGPDAMNTRTNANVMLEAARNFAAAGDNEACWHWYDRAQQVVR